MNKSTQKNQTRTRRHARIRARVSGTAERPRLAVFRSNRFIYAQLIDDVAGVTLVAADSRNASGATPKERGAAVGKKIAELAKGKGVEAVLFDRGGDQYQGIVAALADGAREGGLTF